MGVILICDDSIEQKGSGANRMFPFFKPGRKPIPPGLCFIYFRTFSKTVDSAIFLCYDINAIFLCYDIKRSIDLFQIFIKIPDILTSVVMRAREYQQDRIR